MGPICLDEAANRARIGRTGRLPFTRGLIMPLPIALQLYTIRNILEQDFAGGLRKVAQIGYQNVEVASLGEHSPKDVRRMCDDIGLTIVAWHTPLDAIDSDLDPLILATEALGCRYVVIAYLPSELRTRAGYTQVARTLDRVGRGVAQAGQTLCYHHHSFEWESLPGATGADDARGIDILLNQTDRAHVQVELDLYWVQHAGDDPLAWMNRLSGRVPLLHVKDMADAPDHHFCEVGTGIVDIPWAVAQAQRYGIKHLIVEQDANWIDGDALASARMSYENLKRLVGV